MNKILRIVVIALFFGLADYGFKYPIFHWIIFYFYSNIVIYLTIKTYLYSKKITGIDIANLILILTLLLYLVIYKSSGWLVYMFIFTLLSIIIVSIVALWQKKSVNTINDANVGKK
ncbi:hypothetical protein A3835_09555 (plasmid) [Campylobacter concisus]|uniref:Uncharacterized protein n=1 Tax=Campylobacter concisus TaxID=199 RepID=A0A1X0U529_9BACT|nr:hypothetical protein A3835_09555 [Campylobacter concisus]